MPNKKRRCMQCREYFDMTTMLNPGIGWFCGIEHMKDYGLAKTRKASEKKAKQDHTKKKKEFKLNDLRTRRRAVKEACHKYIRARDKDQPCICCGQPLKPDFHAGHFLESGNNPKIRYNKDNIHGQNLSCNYFKGDSGDYEKNLRAKIGDERVDFLITHKGGTVKRTGPELKEIEDYYKSLYKKLQRDINHAEN